MYVGPNTGGKTKSDLARQFFAYGDVAYEKMLNLRTDKARDTFKRRQGMSDTEFDAFLGEKRQLAQDAKNLHGCKPDRWHPMNLTDMALKVRDNAPPFVDDPIKDWVFSSFVSANSATHSSALSLGSQYKALGNAPLELKYETNMANAVMVAKEAVWGWKTLADYYGQLKVVNECLDRHFQAKLKEMQNNGA